jgi:hypothetical protein
VRLLVGERKYSRVDDSYVLAEEPSVLSGSLRFVGTVL